MATSGVLLKNIGTKTMESLIKQEKRRYNRIYVKKAGSVLK